MPRTKPTKSSSEKPGSTLGFEAQLWAAADKMRGHMDASKFNDRVTAVGYSFSDTHSNEFLSQSLNAKPQSSLRIVKPEY